MPAEPPSRRPPPVRVRHVRRAFLLLAMACLWVLLPGAAAAPPGLDALLSGLTAASVAGMSRPEADAMALALRAAGGDQRMVLALYYGLHFNWDAGRRVDALAGPPVCPASCPGNCDQYGCISCPHGMGMAFGGEGTLCTQSTELCQLQMIPPDEGAPVDPDADGAIGIFCPPGCMVYDSSSRRCIQCYDGYSQIGDLCVQCPWECQVCLTADFAPIDGPLGSGGQARVFAARAIGTGVSTRLGCPDTVAIKQLKADSLTPLQVALFQNEIALMWLLRDQPHIVRIYGFCDQPAAIIMERFDTDLAGLLHSAVDLPLRTRLHLANQWATGLEAMHAQGIAHCDLKPGNVLVSRSAGGWRAALADLGTSRNLRTDRASALLVTVPQLNALSSRYAAPEVLDAFHRRRAMDADLYLPADVYSAAVLLWECLARAAPWQGHSFAQITEHVQAGQRPDDRLATGPVADTAPDLAHTLAHTLGLLWAPDPAARPPVASLRHTVATLAVMLPDP
ncbi:TKL protein kinase [Fonticula alba]|uniref:TKL protein kinase n=1 Tax=Fonticula alba TaxID=691883 RepID=A0A058Z0Q7_FONAL|nr:TKL protein kinase [Fonticula alba]KCV67473.1 TKL protein kinase [Fonticula alba]|eukprot:XP_009498149.1 TKL protein kinase [Fonticula alba]